MICKDRERAKNVLTAQSKTVYEAKEPRGYLSGIDLGRWQRTRTKWNAGENTDDKNKNLEELRNKLEQSKQVKIQRKRNQLSYRENFSRKERSHRLIVCGAIFEKYFPVVKDLSEKELSEVLSSVNVTAFGRELDRAIEQMRKEVTE